MLRSQIMVRPRGSVCVLMVATFEMFGCEREPSRSSERAAPSSSVLDGMQLESARRVANESAVAAMKEGNVQRLKQLSTWVRGRAQVDILRPEEQQALDLAIACLEQVSPPVDADRTLAESKPNVLQQPARDVCASRKARP